MALVFLLYPFRKKSPQQRVTSIDLLLAILSIATIVYIFIDYLGIVQRASLPNQSDLVLSFLMVLLVLEGGRRVVGAGLTILSSLFFMYALFGPYLSELVDHVGYSFAVIVVYLYLTSDGF